VLAVVGWSGSGKTTLLEHLVAGLCGAGLRINIVKHSHHDIELEPPRKDSARLRLAGAAEVMIASPSCVSCAPRPSRRWPSCWRACRRPT
jgi:molybdopterin-guanine dinucleotide biosynthesis protein B